MLKKKTEHIGINKMTVINLHLMLFIYVIVTSTMVMENIKLLLLFKKVTIFSDAYTGFSSSLQADRRLVALKSPPSSQIKLFCCETPLLFNDDVLKVLASARCLVHSMAGKMTRRAPHTMMKNAAR
jgi:hypothetical protein